MIVCSSIGMGCSFIFAAQCKQFLRCSARYGWHGWHVWHNSTIQQNKCRLLIFEFWRAPFVRTSLSCPASLPANPQGGRITNSYYTYDGNEDLMRSLVHQHGAVVSTVLAGGGPFTSYKGQLITVMFSFMNLFKEKNVSETFHTIS